MPELPEVETTVQGLTRYLKGKSIQKVAFHRLTIRYPLPVEWIEKIEQQSIHTIKRRAKLIIMQLDNAYLAWHLGMTGSLRVSKEGEDKRKHDHIEFTLNNGTILRFHDPRRFGYLSYFQGKEALYKSLTHYGPEPLSKEFTGDYLWQLSRHKKQAIKNFIMDQSVVVGVGNIYACEALFAAGIRPQQPAGKISLINYKRLVEQIKKVLTLAIAQGGTTLKDFENADAKPGYFQQSLQVYGREKKPCYTCHTAIRNNKIGGRSSFYCPTCQQ